MNGLHPLPRVFRRLAIYCGSSSSVDPVYLDAARAVGMALAHRGIGVVYGGGRVGLMGEVAEGALEAGGEVIGVITEKLVSFEVGHTGLTERHVVATMHARKAMMADLSDGFVALPGGLGTLEELFEAATWTQLNDHLKPVGILNIKGYWDHLIAFMDHARDERFIRSQHTGIIQADADLDTLISKMEQCELPIIGTWKP